MDEPSLKISPADIGKVLTQVTQGNTQECQQMRQMVLGRFDEIMGIVEADIPLMMLVRNCVKNPRSVDGMRVFRKSLLKILDNKQMKGGERAKKVSDTDGFEDIEEDPLGELGKKIQTLYTEDWHLGEKVAEFSTLSVEFIDLFIGFYTLSNTDDEDEMYEGIYDEEDEDDADDAGDIISINPYDMSIIKIIVSAAQSYLGHLNTHRDRFIEERDSGRWNTVRTLMKGLRGLSFRIDIGKSVSILEYKYFNTIVELLVKWDIVAIEIGDMPEGKDKT